MGPISQQRIALPTGVELDVVVEGPEDGEPLIFLHGFPESHRTWRHQIAALKDEYRVVVPDQRGFAYSSKPEGVENYTPDKMTADLIALADHLGIDQFTLVGHDWGGAVAWMGALKHPERVKNLIIANAAHPYLFQKSLFDDMDQRDASQYITAYRNPNFEKHIAKIGWEQFYQTAFARHLDASVIGDEKAVYLEQWQVPGAMTAMLNWYRGSPMIVPAMNDESPAPDFLNKPFPVLKMPTCIVWAMQDAALRPCLIDGIEDFVEDLTLTRVDGGHFVTWENPDAVTGAIRDFMAARS